MHLVAAELRVKAQEVEAQLREEAERLERQRALRGESGAKARNPWAALAAEDHGSASSSASSSGDEAEAEANSSSVKVPRLVEPPQPRSVDQQIHNVPLFSPAGGVVQETALVDGMVAMVLSVEGGYFDPRRLYVGGGTLVLSDPDGTKMTAAQRLFSRDGRQALDLALLESTASGAKEIAHVPVASLLPDFAVRCHNSLDRMLALNFESGEALCLWFSTPEDCQLCREAVQLEARAASGDLRLH
eukprot:CAMPEP_0170591394 /NCGR_PEP_ID=MMETSP0224-20130122/12380_1 /TAXON_ID=285029 /ORGANISM="Togula jolla, Strain CCCM 725" /LENGTH=244 /DNA_ID=CAMNT_0010915255 /DNA_START=336 /DNA_END=1070 /DNA_ORIENTATION=+